VSTRIRVTFYFASGREQSSHDCETIESAFERLQRTGMDAIAHPVNTTCGAYSWNPSKDHTLTGFRAKLAMCCNSARNSLDDVQIMTAALPVVEAVPASQDSCWPGDGPAHDDDCTETDHAASTAAVAATEGLSWEFSTWTATANWFRAAMRESKLASHESLSPVRKATEVSHVSH
jgi:hypothetical protein